MNFLLVTVLSFAADHMTIQKPDSPTYAWLKGLVGTWSGTSKDHGTFTVTYSLTGNGRCVKETLDMSKHGAMDTIYCDNKDHVVATHYCHSGNQPRLKSGVFAADKKTVAFDFLDATGMSSADEGHMHKLVMEQLDANKLVQKWSFFEKGAEKGVTEFTLARKK